MTRARRVLSDASGAVADLGILVPLAAALVLNNGLDAATVLVGVGALYCAAGLIFGVPVPVQPVKAAAAIAIARDLPAETLAAAGLGLGLVLVALGATGGAALLARVFRPPIVRGIQLGVGLILLEGAVSLAPPAAGRPTFVAAVAVAVVLIATTRRAERWPVALLVVAGGVASTVWSSGWDLAVTVDRWRPSLEAGVFAPATLWAAFTLLVVPQVPLTFGNAVVALTDLERQYYGRRARRVTPAAVSLSSGLANVTVGVLGGMPMCHGSGGLTAHYRAGARSARMNLLIGVPLLVLGLAFGPLGFGLLALIPVAVLMGLLAFNGALHALLVADLRGADLAIALAMGVVGFATSNLAIALALGLVTYWPLALLRRRPVGASA